ncbi:hypothetical protein [Agromyces sp. Soil535]|uniref:hypothetical protein n=1 Tax=Agromyces sp. Soil535 TaxID=1736390 RepID=UPI0006F7CA30|nr:hypothetical protein [Agromyces sp. Soil535]KRE22875.1 hypothetical protein ASG80_08295 [Agromyces sp. Soil535]
MTAEPDATLPAAPRVRGLLRVVFLIHGVITLAAAVVLAVLPAAIPATVGIDVGPDAFLLSYFLAAAELAIGLLSLGAAQLSDPAAVRLIVVVFVVFHLATAALEVVYLLFAPVTAVLLVNIAVRVIAAVVFIVAWRSWHRRVTMG